MSRNGRRVLRRKAAEAAASVSDPIPENFRVIAASLLGAREAVAKFTQSTTAGRSAEEGPGR
jgi:hypothetical protein